MLQLRYLSLIILREMSSNAIKVLPQGIFASLSGLSEL